MAQGKPVSNSIKRVVGPADPVMPYMYWFWMHGYILADGAVKDLEAMKKVEIGRAFIGNIGLTPEEGSSYGKVKMFSNGWWDGITRTFQYASKNNITPGLFNSPGGSKLGVPWRKPNQPIRYVTVKSTAANSPVKLYYNILPAYADTGYIATVAMWSIGCKRLKPALATNNSKAGNLDKLANGVNGNPGNAASG